MNKKEQHIRKLALERNEEFKKTFCSENSSKPNPLITLSMNEEYINKQLAHIEDILTNHLKDGQKLVIERKGDEVEFVISEDFI